MYLTSVQTNVHNNSRCADAIIHSHACVFVLVVHICTRRATIALYFMCARSRNLRAKTGPVRYDMILYNRPCGRCTNAVCYFILLLYNLYYYFRKYILLLYSYTMKQ
jgi:hypothetical protein